MCSPVHGRPRGIPTVVVRLPPVEMTYRSLGQSGLRVSAVGIGCNAFSRRADQESVHAIVAAALAPG